MVPRALLRLSWAVCSFEKSQPQFIIMVRIPKKGASTDREAFLTCPICDWLWLRIYGSIYKWLIRCYATIAHHVCEDLLLNSWTGALPDAMVASTCCPSLPPGLSSLSDRAGELFLECFVGTMLGYLFMLMNPPNFALPMVPLDDRPGSCLERTAQDSYICRKGFDREKT